MFLPPFLRPRHPAASKTKTETGTLTVALSSGPVEVVLRMNARARRYTLRLGARGGQPTVTIPKGGSFRAAGEFVGRHRQWLEIQLDRKPSPQRLQPGDLIALRGVDHRILHQPGARGVVTASEDADGRYLAVSGAAEHLQRRLKDFLAREARGDLAAAVARHAARLGVSVTEIRLRDTVSRWGSANSRGVLMFSWRLIMAPPFVLDYVAAHEVAHLREMNHSPRFWALVAESYGDPEPARLWLKREGGRLQAFFQ